jgi:triacylglycerol esterase/lipase EstA (alpha/beta hydrolase family)
MIRRIASLLLLVGLASALSPARALPSGPPPPGANDFTCRPSAAHPRPVVLVHGTLDPGMLFVWIRVAPALHARGYCVFALDYGNHGTGRIEDSAQELRAFVATVLAATGAAKVDVVAYSSGGLVSRYYMRFVGGAAKVAQLVGVASPTHGSTNPFFPISGKVVRSMAEMVAGSPFLVNLNAGMETLPGIAYTVISTRHDKIVTPYTSQALAGQGSHVTNIVLQDRCPLNLSEHFFIPANPVTLQWIENALDRGGPADPAFQPVC